MLKNKNLGFFCFSPPVMVATFAVEIILLLAVVATRRLNKTGKLICLALFFLAFFQLSEFFVCGGMGMNSETWSRLGFVAISTLPPLGLHIVHSIAGRKSKWLVQAGYALMSVWIVFFAFSESAFSGHQCVTNYVIFELSYLTGRAYTIYYYALLFLGIWYAIKFGENTKRPHLKEALFGMIVGYLVFLLPTAIVYTVNPSTVAGIPSIMCGFAVLFALILYFYVIPRTTKPKK